MNTKAKIAFVACGCLREFSRCVTSWDLFDNQHNYVFTWDTDYQKALGNVFSTKRTFKEEELISAKQLQHIKDYEVFIESENYLPPIKNAFLWSQLDSYLSYDYDYVFITRPDFFITKKNYLEYQFPVEGEIQTFHVDDEYKMASDTGFFMTRATYKKFSNIYQFFNDESEMAGYVHGAIYDFCVSYGLTLTNQLNTIIEGNIFRPFLKATDKVTNKKILQEYFKTKHILEHTTNVSRENYKKIAVLLLNDYEICSNVISIDDNQIYYFVSHNIDIGVEKIKHYSKNYDINFDVIIGVHHE